MDLRESSFMKIRRRRGPSFLLNIFESRAQHEKYIAWRTETGVMAKLGAMFVGDVRVRYFRNMGL